MKEQKREGGKEERKKEGANYRTSFTFQQELPRQNENFLLSSVTIMAQQETKKPSL